MKEVMIRYAIGDEVKFITEGGTPFHPVYETGIITGIFQAIDPPEITLTVGVGDVDEEGFFENGREVALPFVV